MGVDVDAYVDVCVCMCMYMCVCVYVCVCAFGMLVAGEAWRDKGKAVIAAGLHSAFTESDHRYT